MARKKSDKGDEVDHTNLLLEALQEEFGKDEVMVLTAPNALCNVTTWCSTGSMVIDKILEGGRPSPCSLMPFGRQVEISGTEGTGKTTLCAQIAARVQQMGGVVVITDTEDRVDVPYWASLGVDCDRVVHLKAATLEEVFEKQYRAIEVLSEKMPECPLLLLWDSVGGTSSGRVVDSKAMKKDGFMATAEKNMGRDAKALGIGVKTLNALVAKNKVLYLYTNHIYTRMNVTYGDANETPGGRKLKYLATVRIRLSEGASLKEEDALGNTAVVGKRVYIETKKNSMAPKLMKKDAVILGGYGFSNEYTVFEVGKKLGIISTKGAWSTCNMPNGDEIKFQGWSGFLEKVVTHEEYKHLEQSVYKDL